MMANHVSVLSYFLQAGLVVKTVMFLLILASVCSWTLIFQRAWFFKQKQDHYALFNRRFWGSSDLSILYAEIDSKAEERHGLASVFHAGFKEFMRVRSTHTIPLDAIMRVMQIAQAKEAESMQQHLPWFASVGSISPYVGLFGTVWGIMTSFQALGQAQQATIAMVAPGISEALVATALGLFAAIPAVMAFNRFSNSANLLLDRYELFQEEFVALVVQQTHSSAAKVPA